LTEAGNAFVGDIAVNMPLLGRLRYASPFGESSREMAASIKKLIRAGANRIYPAHGQPFSTFEWIKKCSGPK
jgi:glyoxylase-like metal-dependent hydrolase (beta-lactamase superfamily II)